VEIQVVGLAALYAVIEIVKWMIDRNRSDLTPENQRKLNDLWEWHSIRDDDGRPLWYVPRKMAGDQERIVEMLRGISKNQESTARLLGDLIKRMERVKLV